MATDQTTSNRAIYQRFCQAMNTGDAELIAQTIDELVAPDARISTPLPINVGGAEAMKLIFTTLLRAYPDMHISIEDVIAESDRVVGRNVVTGTHRGEYLGLQPTGRSVTYDEIFIFRVVDGRIAETWGVVDVLSQLRQLGAIGDRLA